MININEMFKSIQTEGPFQGQPAWFIRLADCNLNCSFCDTDFTFKKSIDYHDLYMIQEGSLVVITGGEPFLQDLSKLVNYLFDRGARIQIETNGTLRETCNQSKVTIVCSPKVPNIKCAFDYLKILVDDSTTEEDVERYGLQHKIFLQPIFAGEKKVSKNIDNAYRLALKLNLPLSLQWHKFVGIP